LAGAAVRVVATPPAVLKGAPMNDDARVWVAGRRRKGGKASYSIRWVAVDGKVKSEHVGMDRKRAEGMAAERRVELSRGLHHDLKPTSWKAFVDEHVATKPGARNRTEARRALEEFGAMQSPAGPAGVRFGMIEAYVQRLRDGGNTQATVNKKLRYLRHALRRAVRRGYAVKCEMDGWGWVSEEHKPPRIVSEAEEAKLLDKAEALYGLQVRAFVFVAICTGARRSELTGLTWDRVDLGDTPRLHFTLTKAHRDRLVPIAGDVSAMLLRLKAKTQAAGGPFASLADNLGRVWGRIVKATGLTDVSIHDLRRTAITRLIRSGAALPTVQKLVGHADIKTTLTYYNWTSEDDMRKAVNAVQSKRTAVAG